MFDRSAMKYFPLSERKNKVYIEKDSINPNEYIPQINEAKIARIQAIADEIKQAKKVGASRMCAFGAHTIKNGLGKILGALAEEGWFTHLATNGAGIIHDWEFAYQGKSSEDVRANVQKGMFGTWQETGFYINLAIALGALEGLGYGESVGRMIADDGLMIPSASELEKIIENRQEKPSRRAAAADMLSEIEKLNLSQGWIPINHPYKDYSVQYRCYKASVPFTDHPMFGHDIIYTHNANLGAAIGRTAETDFLKYAESVSNLENGVYLSIGSAVMSPMIFEKSISMARNVLRQEGKDIRNTAIHVADLAEETWDWSKGEPPMDNPAYYHRFMKTFSRMGCRTDYMSIDNRDFIVCLYKELHKES